MECHIEHNGEVVVELWTAIKKNWTNGVPKRENARANLARVSSIEWEVEGWPNCMGLRLLRVMGEKNKELWEVD